MANTTAQQPQSLHDQHAHRWDVPLVDALTAVCLLVGLVTPTVTLERLVVDQQTYSIISGIGKLFTTGNVILGLIVLAFSGVFPIVKVGCLFGVWYMPLRTTQQQRLVNRLRFLGKWSMLDAFVVVLFLGAVRLGIIADAEAHYGIFIFALAILLSLAASFLTGTCLPGPAKASTRLVSARHWPLVSLISLTLFGLGICLPLMRVEKWIFWRNKYSLVHGTLQLAREENVWLAVLFALLVIVLPLLEQLGLLAISLTGRLQQTPRWLERAVPVLNEWAMADVFALALFIVVVRLGGLAHVTPQVGLFCYALAIASHGYLAWQFRRALARD